MSVRSSSVFRRRSVGMWLRLLIASAVIVGVLPVIGLAADRDVPRSPGPRDTERVAQFAKVDREASRRVTLRIPEPTFQAFESIPTGFVPKRRNDEPVSTKSVRCESAGALSRLDTGEDGPVVARAARKRKGEATLSCPGVGGVKVLGIYNLTLTRFGGHAVSVFMTRVALAARAG